MARITPRYRRDFTLDIQQEQVFVHSVSEPDPGWSHVDQAGHLHARVKGAYPTLKWVEDEPGYVDSEGEEYPPVEHQECVHCGELIRPGTRSSMGRNIPGPIHALVTVGLDDGRTVVMDVTEAAVDDIENAPADKAAELAIRALDGDTSVGHVTEVRVDG